MDRVCEGQLLDFSDSFVISCGTVTFDLSRTLVLLIQNKANGAILLPKGRKDVDEGLEEAAIRETREEAGYEVQMLRHCTKTRATGIKTGSHREPIAVQQRMVNGIRKLIFWYLASADSTTPQVSGDREAWEEEYETIWRPADEAPALVTFKEDRQIVALGTSIVAKLPKPDEPPLAVATFHNQKTNTESYEHKDLIRQKVYPQLAKVAIPDSRFHLDFSSYITDFQDSDKAITRLIAHSAWRSSQTIFITPDNCLRHLRDLALRVDKTVLTTTYGIRRGFYLLSPDRISSPSQAKLASYLDSMEDHSNACGAHPVPLISLPPIDLLVTGTGAINHSGIRFGKGHGYFDLEWSILYSLKLVTEHTPCVSLVHDCQVLDEELVPEVWDTVCDVIVTPTRTLEVVGARKPRCGILWDRLQPGMLEEIPPLMELKGMQ